MTGPDDILSRSESVVTKKTGNEYVLVPVVDNIADMDSVYTLNETGTFIWEKIDGEKTVRELIKAVVEEYNTDTETATADLMEFIDEMKLFLIIK
ncbi:MAG TPA: PqqD family protein [Bacteroidales bacterium]|nr:PqqD family protein [Bacteroidales bacterium]HPF03931.1 PqqD family protein [Bacteroidales bacterium]HPJ60273.1 PqqD family protein [Bacteroidales bacterium]HPR11881.1 PqqD family protein [Bacteroidales bacterium]HRW83970.1 PqqD family protein [Bacteroidales bacterium]